MRFRETLVAALAMISSALMAADNATPVNDISLEEFRNMEIQRREIARLLAPVKSRADLDVAVAEKQLAALNKFSSPARQRFVDSLTFNESGLTGFYYADLESELTPSEIYAVLSLFGAQHLIANFKNARMVSTTDALLISTPSPYAVFFEDHIGYKCEYAHTCVRSSNHICMSGC